MNPAADDTSSSRPPARRAEPLHERALGSGGLEQAPAAFDPAGPDPAARSLPHRLRHLEEPHGRAVERERAAPAMGVGRALVPHRMCGSEQLEGGVVREDGIGPRRRSHGGGPRISEHG